MKTQAGYDLRFTLAPNKPLPPSKKNFLYTYRYIFPLIQNLPLIGLALSKLQMKKIPDSSRRQKIEVYPPNRSPLPHMTVNNVTDVLSHSGCERALMGVGGGRTGALVFKRAVSSATVRHLHTFIRY